MYYDNLDGIKKAAVLAAEREGVPFYILCNPSITEKKYTALSSRGFGLPAGFYIEEMISPVNKRPEIEPEEKTSTNGF
jgi:hypothetical protein